jgi:hypothetical protein
MTNCNGLKNVNLGEAPLSATQYNKLPHIDSMRDAAAKNVVAHAQLLGLIALHGLSEHFSIHLIHKHFDISEGLVMVYEAIKGPNHPEFVLCNPRKPNDYANLRGLYFRASPGGKMFAYEYTTEPGKDLSAHADFVSTFARAVLYLGVQDVFALTAKKLHQDVLTEFEMSDLLSTVLVHNPTWLAQDLEPGQSTTTDWIATPGYSAYANGPNPTVPGIIGLKCLKTRSDRHINVTCSTTRSGTHYGQKSAYGSELLLDGQPLPKDSEAYTIISHAREIVSAL